MAKFIWLITDEKVACVKPSPSATIDYEESSELTKDGVVDFVEVYLDGENVAEFARDEEKMAIAVLQNDRQAALELADWVLENYARESTCLTPS